MKRMAYFMPLGKVQFVGLIFFVVLIAAVVIGLCVGLDARKRGIKPASIWGIVAALAPGFTGVIGYLIVRYFDDKKKSSQEG